MREIIVADQFTDMVIVREEFWHMPLQGGAAFRS